MKRRVLPWIAVCTVLLCCGACTGEKSSASSAHPSGWTEANSERSYYVNGEPLTGWQLLDGKTVYFSEQGILHTGWLETGDGRYYLDESGVPLTGWQSIGDKQYYFTAKGTLHTGWLEQDGDTYYLLKDGTPARGRITVDGEDCFFTSDGCQILLVNPWHTVPEDYEPDLVEVQDSYIASAGTKVDRSCYDALLQMMADCNEKSGARVYIVSSYRTTEHQTRIFNRKVSEWEDLGYEEAEAKKKAATSVAIPGTSEHQLGLAVDIVDTQSWKLTDSQETYAGQQWLIEHCWKYGFVLRYPDDKTDITGIIYEPWHYRYVGTKVAKELRDAGLTLEEYLSGLTYYLY